MTRTHERKTDERRSARKPARLHPAKLLGADFRFVGDCAILDRSTVGARVGLFDTAPLPETMTLYDESEKVRRDVRLVWQSGPLAGLSFQGEPIDVDGRAAERISGRYYALD